MSNSNSPKSRILKVPPLLQQKVGSGSIPEKAIRRGQRTIDQNKEDFQPLAEEAFNELMALIEGARKQKNQAVSSMNEALVAPVMALKANAGMFGYPLVSRLAGIMLAFLEAIDEVDSDVINIAEAHVKTLKMLVRNKVQEAEGDYATQLETELRDVCRRYFAKQASSRKTGKEEPFFID